MPTTTNAIRVHEHGGPEVLRWEEIEVADPGPGEALVRNHAVGLNFIDVYHRTGLYPQQTPLVLGGEGAGTVEAVGADVADLAPGDRVAYFDPGGAYAERLIRPIDRLVRLPEAIGEEQAAAMMLKGLTAEYLSRRTHRVEPGETILVHAAAGGVGHILCQWAAALGATVIGTVGSAAKADFARAAGCAHVIATDREDFVARTRKITGGKGVPVVYDGVGAATFMGSLDCLAPLGLLAVFGNASGAVPPFDPRILSAKGSLFLTRPTLFHYAGTSAELRDAAAALFGMVTSGRVKIEINQTYPLAEAARAHADLEARKLTGSTVLLA